MKGTMYVMPHIAYSTLGTVVDVAELPRHILAQSPRARRTD